MKKVFTTYGDALDCLTELELQGYEATLVYIDTGYEVTW